MPSRLTEALTVAFAFCSTWFISEFFFLVPISQLFWRFLPLMLASSGLLLWRKNQPLLTFLGIVVVVLISNALDLLPWHIAIIIASYAAARYGNNRQSVIVGVVYICLETYIQILHWTGLSVAYIFVTIPVISWLMGDRSRLRDNERLALSNELESLQSEQERREREAVTSERLHIARELHDIVSHSLSAIVMYAGGARNGPYDTPREVVDALSVIEDLGRQDLKQIHQLLEGLRTEGEPLEIAPSLTVAELDQLLKIHRVDGLQIELFRSGQIPPLPPNLELAVHRIVHESLTNTRRHSTAKRAMIWLGYSGQGLNLCIRDYGERKRSSFGSGLGLLGMQERVALLKGSFKAVEIDGGFEVSVFLPTPVAQGARS